MPNYIIVPNLSAYVREVTEYGVMKATINRFMKLSFLSKCRLMGRNIVNLPKLALKDFNQGSLLLVEMEILQNKDPKINAIVLDSQLVDMMVCLKNETLFKGFQKLAKDYHLTPILMTYNAGLVIPFLTSQHIQLKLMTPVNKQGKFMYPNQKDINKLLEDRLIKSQIIPMSEELIP